MANDKDTAARPAGGTGEASANDARDDAARRFGQFFGTPARATGEVADRTSRGLDVMIRCGSAVTDGWQSIVREWLAYGQGAFQRNMDGVNEMMRARTFEDFVSAQNERLRAEMELLLDSSARVSEITARIATDARQGLNEGTGRGRRA